jgi:hypothetical protein
MLVLNPPYNFLVKRLGGVAMKPQAKILALLIGLMLPYMGFVLYRAFTYPEHILPNWFLYVGPCYFFGSIALAVVLRKKTAGATAPQDSESQRHSAADLEVDRRRLKSLWIGVGLYSLIFLNGLRFGFANAGELPMVIVILGEVLNVAILTTIVLSLRKVYKRVQEADRLASDR